MNFILASTSTMFGQDYLAYLSTALEELLSDIEEVTFIPFARPLGISYDEYTKKAAKFFQGLEKKVKGLHEFQNPVETLQNAEAIFTGGGNTFLLLKTLYELNLMETLRQKIQDKTPYLGTSAGSNIAGQNIKTTNDMPIVHPPSFEALKIIPFNINPHYLDPDPNSTHNGETREVRILEFLSQNETPVIGLREGSWIRGVGEELHLKGKFSARIFLRNQKPYEIETESDLKFLKA